jgi:hypothetical protein
MVGSRTRRNSLKMNPGSGRVWVEVLYCVKFGY